MRARRKEVVRCAETCSGQPISSGSRKRQVCAVKVLAIGIVVFLMACTSLHKIAMSEEELHQQVRAGDLLNKGDRVQVFTLDNKRREIWVIGVDDTFVHGEQAVRAEAQVHGQRQIERKEVSIAIEDIVGIKTREFSIGKTAVLSVGLYYLMIGIATAAAVGNM